MSIAIPVRPDEFLLDLIEDERDVPCNVATPACPRSALWAVRCPSCSFDHQVCERHRKAVDTLARRSNRPITCRMCMTPGSIPVPVAWRPL